MAKMKNNIRKCCKADIDSIVNIWLEGSKDAHWFIAGEVWDSAVEEMKSNYIPNSETYVYETESKIVGFLSLSDNNLAALFIDVNSQNQGIGKELLRFAKSIRDRLELKVYQKNLRAIEFYKRNGFVITKSGRCDFTNSEEYYMTWISERGKG